MGVVETGGSGRSRNDGGDSGTRLDKDPWAEVVVSLTRGNWFIMPADGQEGTRATTKTLSNRGREGGDADLVLDLTPGTGRVEVIRETPRLEAGTGENPPYGI